MFKKSLAFAALAAVLSLNTVLPTSQVFAAASKPVQAAAAVAPGVTAGQVEAAGKWGYLVRGALYTIKQGLKYGTEIFQYIGKWLDSKTLKYFSENLGRISKGLDNAIAKIDDAVEYTTAVVRQIVLDGLRIAGVPDTYGVGIADAIATAVDWLIL